MLEEVGQREETEERPQLSAQVEKKAQFWNDGRSVHSSSVYVPILKNGLKTIWYF